MSINLNIGPCVTDIPTCSFRREGIDPRRSKSLDGVGLPHSVPCEIQDNNESGKVSFYWLIISMVKTDMIKVSFMMIVWIAFSIFNSSLYFITRVEMGFLHVWDRMFKAWELSSAINSREHTKHFRSSFERYFHDTTA